MFASHVNTHVCCKEKETLSADSIELSEQLQNSLDLSQLSSLQELAAIEGFQPIVDSNSSFFCKKLKILLRHPDLPVDTLRVVTLRLTLHKQDTSLVDERHGLQSCTRRMFQNSLLENHSCTSFQELLFEIFDEEDPFTLLQFRLTRSKFSELRDEQRLLVDFNGFPDVVIELLQRCNVSCEESLKYSQDSSTVSNDLHEKSIRGFSHSTSLVNDKVHASCSLALQETSGSLHRTSSNYSLIPLLLCDVASPSNDSDYSSLDFLGKYRQPSRIVFTLVETNNFRELTHLFLPFSVASPTKTLHHLVERFSHVKRYTLCLETNFFKLKDLYSESLKEIQSKNRSIEEIKKRLQTIQCQLTECHQEEILRIQQEASRTLLVTEKRVTDEYKIKETNFLSQIEILEKEAKVLQDSSADLKEKLSNITLEKEECDNINKSLKEIVQSLTHELAIESKTCRTLKEDNADLKNECLSLSSSLKKEEENVKQLTDQLKRLDEYKVQLTNLTQRESELCSALQTSSLEIEKGNKLIETLQQALRKERYKNKSGRACCHRNLTTELYEKEKIDDLSQHGHLLLKREASLLRQVEILQHQLHQARQTEEHQKIKIETLQSQFKETSVHALLNTSLQLQTQNPGVTLNVNDVAPYPQDFSTHHNYATRFYPNSLLPKAPPNFPTHIIDDDQNPCDTSPHPAPKPTQFCTRQPTPCNSKSSELLTVTHKASLEPTLLSHVSNLHQNPSTSFQKSSGTSLQKMTSASLPKTTGASLPKTTGAFLQKTTGASLQKTTGASLQKTTGASLQKTTVASLHKTSNSFVPKTTGAALQKTSNSSLQKTTGASFKKFSLASLQKTIGASLHKTTGMSVGKTSGTFLHKTSAASFNKISDTTAHKMSGRSPRKTLGGSPRSTLSGSPSNALGESPRTALDGSSGNTLSVSSINTLSESPKSTLGASPRYSLGESPREELDASFKNTSNRSPRNTTHASLDNEVLPPYTHRSTDTTPSFSTLTFFNDASKNEAKNEPCILSNTENVLGVSLSTYEYSSSPHFG